jgi:hypothetical protein
MRLWDWFLVCYCVPMTALLVAVISMAMEYILERGLQ